MSRDVAPLCHSAEGIGPASESVSLAQFREEAGGRDATALPAATESALNGLSNQHRRMLNRRLDVRALRETADSVLRIESYRVDMDNFQRARLLAGSESREAIAHAQNLMLGPEKLEPITTTTGTRKKRRASTVVEPEEDEDLIKPGTRAKPLSERAARVTAEEIFQPPEHAIPHGLRIYRAFQESQHYMRRVRPSDQNTLVRARHHPRSLRRLPPTSAPPTAPVSDSLPPNDSPDQLVTVTWHAIRNLTASRSATTNFRTLQVILPASQTLADLRDMLICGANAQPAKASDEEAAAGETHSVRPRTSGSVFLIEGVMHPDTRDGRTDYAEMLRGMMPADLFEDSEVEEETIENSETAQLRSKRRRVIRDIYNQATGTTMQETRLSSLELRIGEPYWFLHQGNCEHILTFDSVRAMHENDIPTTSGPDCPYPMLTVLSRLDQPKCRICNREAVVHFVIGDELAGETPTMLCDECLWHLHGRQGFLHKDPAQRAAQMAQAKANCRETGAEIIPYLDDIDGSVPRL